MSDNTTSEMPATDDAITFDEPTDTDFEDDIPDEEKDHYKTKFKDLNSITQFKLHCTSCDKHLGCAPKSEHKMRTHPMLRALVCQQCQAFYNSGEFEKGDDGSELYCRWCGQGGQVFCCSQCPHVFCAKCIRRNLGQAKVKQIENTDDWKCFKCEPEDLYDLRALCWAVLRYCDLKNKLAYKTQDPDLKDKYQKDCAVDHSTCCNKLKRRSLPIKKKEIEDTATKRNAELLSKFPPTIQVKKFALIADDKKAEKRKISPVKPKFNLNKNPTAPPNFYSYTRPGIPAKKPKLAPKLFPNNVGPINIGGFNPSATIRHMVDKRVMPAGQIIKMPSLRPIMPIPVRPSMNSLPTQLYNNGYNVIPNDNINLSLESLTQGLDFAAVAAMDNSGNDDVVCTPDFPMEPLCEVTEDANDDDVECMTPGPIAAPKNIPTKSHLLRRLQDPSNIVQMTENDVSVNTVTGGLKFRVDPQTLSANKMYRLPDGRVFAINPNPKMPGGYSATIVSDGNKPATGKTFAAKLSAVTSVTPQNKAKNKPTPQKKVTITRVQKVKSKTKDREMDLDVPVEWFRYNLIDAIDSLEYSVMRLQRLKNEATTTYLRTRKVDEIKFLHNTLERLLTNSSKRFEEIRVNLNTGFKSYLKDKGNEDEEEVEDDDDVQILPDNSDDPIYIDENSVGSANDTADDVQLLSDSNHNDSAEKEKEESSNKQNDSNDSEPNETSELGNDDNNSTTQDEDSIKNIKETNDTENNDGDSKDDNKDESDIEMDADKERDDDDNNDSQQTKQTTKVNDANKQGDDDDLLNNDDDEKLNTIDDDKNIDDLLNNDKEKTINDDKGELNDKESLNGSDNENMDLVDELLASTDNEEEFNKETNDSKETDLNEERIEKLLKEKPDNPDMEGMPSLEEFQDQSILTT